MYGSILTLTKNNVLVQYLNIKFDLCFKTTPPVAHKHHRYPMFGREVTVNILKSRVLRRASYLMFLVVVVLSGCGIGRYNNQPLAMTWPTNTTYYYSTTGTLVGSSVSYK